MSVTNTVAPPTDTSAGKEAVASARPEGVVGTNCFLLLEQFLIMSITSSTRCSSVHIRKVLFPDMRNPPVEASFVAEKPFFVSSVENLVAVVVVDDRKYQLHRIISFA